jgi:hypothetical protein
LKLKYNNGTDFIKINGWSKMNNGVRQVSILLPALFNLMRNETARKVTGETNATFETTDIAYDILIWGKWKLMTN